MYIIDLIRAEYYLGFDISVTFKDTYISSAFDSRNK